jgi:hypothetical protein
MRPTLLMLVPAVVLQAAPMARPMWISVLPVQGGRVYGLGLAPLATDAETLRSAADNARADVITRLRANVKADTRITTVSNESRSTGAAATGSRTQNTEVGTQVQAQATDLPGLVVQETFLDRPGRTGYALAYLDLDICQRELRTRLDNLMADLAADRGETGTRARLVAVQALKKTHGELLRLDDMAGLLSGGGGDPGLRSEVLKARLDTERQLVAARAALTFGLSRSPGVELDPDVQDVVRTCVLKEGMGWSDRDPVFTITLRAQNGGSGATGGRRAWWDIQRSMGFTIARGGLGLTLVDNTGQEYETMNITAKGVASNNDEPEAVRKLLADTKAKLGQAVAAWLADLGKW